MTTKEDTTYNGWANWETWNVALWMGNDEALYSIARGCKDYKTFQERVIPPYPDGLGLDSTEDGAAWDDPELDIEALDEMMKEGEL